MNFYKVVLEREIPEKKIYIMDNPLDCLTLINIIELKEEHPDWGYEECEEYFSKNNLKYYNTYLNGSFDAHYFAFYDFIFDELKVKIDKTLMDKYAVYRKTIDFGNVYCFEEACFISRKPVVIKKNEKGLHSEDSPAVSYVGLDFYFKNGEKLSDAEIEEIEERMKMKFLEMATAGR